MLIVFHCRAGWQFKNTRAALRVIKDNKKKTVNQFVLIVLVPSDAQNNNKVGSSSVNGRPRSV